MFSHLYQTDLFSFVISTGSFSKDFAAVTPEFYWRFLHYSILGGILS